MSDVIVFALVIIGVGVFIWAWRYFFTADQKATIKAEADYLKTKGEDLASRGVNEFKGTKK